MSESTSGILCLVWLGYGSAMVVAGGKHLAAGLIFLGLSFVCFLVWLWAIGVRVIVRRSTSR